MNISFTAVARFVWSHVRKKPVWLGTLVVLIILQTVTEVIQPIFIGELTNLLAANYQNTAQSLNPALHLLGLITATGLSYWIIRTVNSWCFDHEKLKIMQNVAIEAFSKVQRFSTEWHVNSFAGATVRRISRGIWSTSQFMNEFFFGFIPLFFLIIGFATAMLLRWRLMGLLVILGSIIYAAISIYLTKKIAAPYYQKAAQLDTRLGARIADAITCNPTVKIFGRENSEDARLTETAQCWRKANWRAWFCANGLDFIQALPMTALKLGMLLLVVWMWKNNKANVGDLAFVIGSYSVVSSHLRSIGERIREVQHAASDMEDIVAFSLMPILVADQQGAKDLSVKKGEIEFKNVSFCYANQNRSIYRNLSVKIKAGERIALVGHSGGGKSTFVKLIQRLYDLENGQILIDGQDISQVKQKSLRRAVGLVPQEPILFHRTLAENISYGKPKATPAEIKRAARLAHAAEFIEKMPKKYETLVGERGIKLSGGERQRVAIARAMLADTPILILDEATSSLDSGSETLIQDALQKLMKNRTTIIIAHRLSTIKNADRILVFDGGRIVEQGTHTTLVRKKRGVYRRYYELQAGGFIGE